MKLFRDFLKNLTIKKVYQSINNHLKFYRFVLIAVVRIQNGAVLISASSYAFNALAPTEVMESILVLYALSKWTNGREQNLSKWN